MTLQERTVYHKLKDLDYDAYTKSVLLATALQINLRLDFTAGAKIEEEIIKHTYNILIGKH